MKNGSGSAFLGVVRVRLGQLRQAIMDRDWDEVEFQFDRVLRAVEKMERQEAR